MPDVLKKYIKKHIRNDWGYTLIEIIVAIAILGIGLLSVAGIYPVGISYIRNSSEKVFVIQQSQAIVESLKTMSYEQLYDIYVDAHLGFLEQNPLKDTNGIYHPGYISRIDVSMPSPKNVLLLRVTITWNQENSHMSSTVVTKSYVLETIKASTDPR